MNDIESLTRHIVEHFKPGLILTDKSVYKTLITWFEQQRVLNLRCWIQGVFRERPPIGASKEGWHKEECRNGREKRCVEAGTYELVRMPYVIRICLNVEPDSCVAQAKLHDPTLTQEMRNDS